MKYGGLILTAAIAVVFVAVPYGWPRTSFVNNVPSEKQVSIKPAISIRYGSKRLDHF